VCEGGWGKDRQSKGTNERRREDHSLAKGLQGADRTMEVDRKIQYVE
jgi:hypothetical protein